MKAILLFTVLLCSNALASPSGFRCGFRALASCIHPSRPSTERTALASTSSLSGPPSTEPRLPSRVDPVDKFFDICQSYRYFACQKSARVLLKENTTGKFARELLRNAIDKENAWAVSALLDNLDVERLELADFYFELFENFFKKGEDKLVFEVLARKCKEINPNRVDLVTSKYKNIDSLVMTVQSIQPRPNFVPVEHRLSINEFKRFIEKGEHEFVLKSTRFFTPHAFRQANVLSHASKHGDQFMVFYATKHVDPSDPSIDEAYKEAKNPAEYVPSPRPVIRKSAIMPIFYKDTEDVVKYLEEIIAKRG